MGSGPAVSLRELDKSNWFACTRLSVSEAQQQLFPAPVVYWIAESKYETSLRPLAVYAAEELVGFAVHGQDPEDGLHWIVALLIDHHHQRRGYGRAAVLALIDLIKREHAPTSITIGHRAENAVAGNLYEQLGFRRLRERRGSDGGIEVVRQLVLAEVMPTA